jgi:hypothetical protein
VSLDLNTSMSSPSTADQIIQRIATRTGLQPGWNDEARHAATPYVVEWRGLTREHIGDAEFEEKLWEARHWCNERCPQDYEIEPIRERGRLVGRQFRFANDNDAALFKLWLL